MRWSKYDKQYYGVRTGNKCEPENDLWHKYRSSSPDTKEFIEKHGKPDIIYVDKTFDDPEEARDYEVKILQENDVVNDDRWLNKNDRRAPPSTKGMKHTPETKRLISEALKKYFSIHDHPNIGKIGPAAPMYGKKHTSDTKQKMSEARKGQHAGEKNPMYGKKHSPETIELMSESMIGEKNPMFKGRYVTPWGIFDSTILAAKNCPVFIKRETIGRWCKNNEKVISKNAVGPSSYLTKEMIGKTFKEIGFDFIPK